MERTGEKVAVDIAGRRVDEQEHSSSQREFFSRIPDIAREKFASTAVPVISPAEATDARGSPGAVNAVHQSIFGLNQEETAG